LAGTDPLVHALVWSIGLNSLALIVISLLTTRSPLEELQSTLFVDVFRLEPGETHLVIHRSAASEDLFVLAQRILGAETAQRLFSIAARSQGRSGNLPDPTPAFITQLERELAGSVGAASAHAMVNRTAGGETISLQELMQIADETAQLMRYSNALASKSSELEEVANQLRSANEQLRTLDMQKDEFLSQVSHELRTPMTSIRSMSEILLSDADISDQHRRRFANIIQEESQRLTRLLDEILDMSFLEKGELDWRLTAVDVEPILESSLNIALVPMEGRQVKLIAGQRAGKVRVMADADRLAQVFLNVVANAVRHNHSAEPWVKVDSQLVGNTYEVTIEDNGAGIADELRSRIFEKFARGGTGGGFGLGLAISHQIMTRLGGKLEVLPKGEHGARFKMSMPALAD
jgi:signal transduction histidine kinase